MSRPASDTARDPLRAMFLCLVVIAQLLLPSVFEQARASEDSSCVALGGTADAGKGSKKPTHLHGQECVHCRPQAVVLATPVAHPEIVVVPAFEAVAAHPVLAIAVVALQPLPPATGPPLVSVSV